MAKSNLCLFETVPINLNKDKNDYMKEYALRGLCNTVGNLGRKHLEHQYAKGFYLQALPPMLNNVYIYYISDKKKEES